MIRLYVVAASYLASLTGRREGGQGLAEYALAAALVAAVAAVALGFLGDALDAFYQAMKVRVST